MKNLLKSMSGKDLGISIYFISIGKNIPMHWEISGN